MIARFLRWLDLEIAIANDTPRLSFARTMERERLYLAVRGR